MFHRSALYDLRQHKKIASRGNGAATKNGTALARFELAQVLWLDRPSRDRVKVLATQAEQALAGLGEAEAKELARVRASLSRVAGR